MGCKLNVIIFEMGYTYDTKPKIPLRSFHNNTVAHVTEFGAKAIHNTLHIREDLLQDIPSGYTCWNTTHQQGEY